MIPDLRWWEFIGCVFAKYSGDAMVLWWYGVEICVAFDWIE
jgi:hypothetical protein